MKTTIEVKNNIIRIIKVNNVNYISLTGLAKIQNDESPADVVKNWMRSKETLSFLGVQEGLNNEIFKLVEFDSLKMRLEDILL